MDIWEILCIVPTKDVAAIKRAYEQQIKYFNKTEDPEGHRRIEKAFAKALRYAGSWESPAKATNITQESPIYSTSQFVTKSQPPQRERQKRTFSIKGVFIVVGILIFAIKSVSSLMGTSFDNTNSNFYDSSYLYEDIGYDNVNEYAFDNDFSLKEYKQLKSFKGVDASYIGKKRNVVVERLANLDYFVSYVDGKTGTKRFKFFVAQAGDSMPISTFGRVNVAYLGKVRMFFVTTDYGIPSYDQVPQTKYSGEFIKMSDSLYKKFIEDMHSIVWAGKYPKMVKDVMFVYDGYDDSEWNY